MKHALAARRVVWQYASLRPTATIRPGDESPQVASRVPVRRRVEWPSTRRCEPVIIEVGMRIEVNPQHPEPHKIRRAVEALRAGEVIGYPTDTVYALGCSPLDKKAIDRLYLLKNMPRTQPLALICTDLSQVAQFAQLDNQAFRLLRRVLPGPYCVILEATRETPRQLHLKNRTVGVRVPASAVAIAIVQELGHPLISTTAARHGEAPPLDAAELADRFPMLEIVLDTGPGGSVPSTVVDLSTGTLEIVREGAGSIEALEQ